MVLLHSLQPHSSLAAPNKKTSISPRQDFLVFFSQPQQNTHNNLFFRSPNMNTSSSCSGYLSSPSPSLNNSYCAMPNCALNHAAMKTCCKNAAVVTYTMPPPSSSNATFNPNLNGIYCFIGNESFAEWSNCTSQQGVEAGLCATGVEAFASGAGGKGVGSLMGLVGLLLLARAMLW